MREGLMMDDYPLTLTYAVQRVERFSADREVVFRRPDGSVGRTTMGECAQRARRLAGALARRGIHNEAAELLRERLAGKIEVDFDTARRLFTLICVLHIKA